MKLFIGLCSLLLLSPALPKQQYFSPGVPSGLQYSKPDGLHELFPMGGRPHHSIPHLLAEEIRDAGAPRRFRERAVLGPATPSANVKDVVQVEGDARLARRPLDLY